MRTLHVVSHTHWDREWYLPYQEFRFRLVRLIDCLLDIMTADPEFKHFMLDGQTIVLDDYVEIRPEQEPRIKQLIEEGRLLVGPWYVLPDEFLEGPEALLRNLSLGHRGCRRFSEYPQPIEHIGYLPDPFGHLSQLPQIAAGCGLSALCFWRGVGDAPTEFRWAAPDSTECLVVHLRTSYGNAARLAEGDEAFEHDLVAARDELAPHATTSHLLLMQGTDHMEPRADLPALLRTTAQSLDDRVIHSTLPGYVSAVRAELGTGKLKALPRIEGELRSPRYAHLLPAVLSARMWIKQWNHRCETLLTRWAEPLEAIVGLLTGQNHRHAFLEQSWEWLLQNHAHDSICGCSVDQVHREMQARFAWSEQIALQVARSSLQALARSVDTATAAVHRNSAASIVVFNPLPAERSERVEALIPATPGGGWILKDLGGLRTPHRVLEHVTTEHYNELMPRQAFLDWLLRMASGRGPDGGKLVVDKIESTVEEGIAELLVWVVKPDEVSPAALVGDEDSARIQALIADERIESFRVRIIESVGVKLECLVRDVPPCGYTQLAVVQHDSDGQQDSAAIPGPSHTIENEFFFVEADPHDGTLTLTDKRTGQVMHGLNRFVDGGDRGDEYTFCQPESDLIVDSPSTPPSMRVLDDPMGATLEIDLSYQLPRALTADDRARRDLNLVTLPISTRATLTPGVPRLDVETVVDNTARDHRLRVHFPTALVTDSTWAESHFDVVQRPIAKPQDTVDWAEQPAGTHPQNAFVDVTDGLLGFMLANRGLPEYEAIPSVQDGSVTLALTLLRCVGWLSRGDLHNRRGHAGPLVPTPEAQCAGIHTFHYSLIPHTGNYLTAISHAHAFAVPLMAVGTRSHDGKLPPSLSFVEVAPAAVILSAIKPSLGDTGSITLRIYNSASTALHARIKFWRPIYQVDLVALHERDTVRRLEHAVNSVTLPLRPKEIATLRVQLQENEDKAHCHDRHR